jgi:hypothetical protein
VVARRIGNRRQCQRAGTPARFELAIRFVQLFDCYRAVWTDRSGAAAGAVVGSDDREAAVYALAQLRKSTALAAAKP